MSEVYGCQEFRRVACSNNTADRTDPRAVRQWCTAVHIKVHVAPRTATLLPAGTSASQLDVTGIHRYIECNQQVQINGGAMSKDLTDLQLLHELEPVVERNINRHMSMRKDWNPHDYIPWSDGKNYYALGGQDWHPEQSKLSEVAQVAMVQNLLTEDNLPSYHREIAMNFAHGRRVGLVGQPLDRRGEPARHRAARLPGRHPRHRSGRAGGTPPGAGDPRLQPRPEPAGRPVRREPVRLRHLRDVPGAGHPRLAPQHRQGVRRADRRPTAAAGLGRREPAHDLLPGRHRRRPGHRAQPGDEVAAPRAAQLQDARLHRPGVPAQGRDHRGRRGVRPAHPPRRRGDAGTEEVAHLRARGLHR